MVLWPPLQVKEIPCDEMVQSADVDVEVAGSNETCVIYTTVENLEMTQTMWYKIYIGGSETVLRLGPITVLCYLNSWIIVGLLRLSKNRQVLRGTATQRRSNTEPRASSTMLPPPAAVLAARANGHSLTNGCLVANGCSAPLLPAANNAVTNCEACPQPEKSERNGSVVNEDQVAGSAPGSGSGDQSVNGSAASSRRETPPQNQSFHNLLVRIFKYNHIKSNC